MVVISLTEAPLQTTMLHLTAAARTYFNLGISAATRRAYTASLQKYITFCYQTRQQAVPATEETLLLFATHLAQQGLSHSTIQVYLSAVRYFHIAAGEYSTSTTQTTPRMNQLLKGIRKSQAMTRQSTQRQPITFQIMESLYTVLSKHTGGYYNMMIWAACCTAYFGLLRVSEFTSPANHSNTTNTLQLADVALDSRTEPKMIRLTLKQSKTDQFRQGTQIHLGATNHHVCPVQALVRYLANRGGTPGPLFILPNKKPLTRAMFSTALTKALKELNMDSTHFNTHSFRIGAATSAKQAGISDSHLKALGRWKSDAYLKYIRLSPQDLAKLSQALVSVSTSTPPP